MTRNSEISRLLPSNVEKIVNSLKRGSFAGFWLQIVLGVVSAVTLLFATPVLVESKDKTQSTSFGILCAVVSLILLITAIVFSFRYGKIAKKIENLDPTQRPKKSDTIKFIQSGLIINLVGMLLATIGAQALVGIVLAKSLARPQIAVGLTNPTDFVNSIDLLIIQANTNTITAHFSGIVTSLWLLNRISR